MATDAIFEVEVIAGWFATCEAAGDAILSRDEKLWISSLRRRFDEGVRQREKRPIGDRQAEILRSFYEQVVEAQKAPPPSASTDPTSPKKRGRGKKYPPLPPGSAPRSGSLKGSEKQRTLGYAVRDLLVDTITEHLRDRQAAGDLDLAKQIDALLVEVTKQSDSAWFRARRTVLWNIPPDPLEAVRRALLFATWTPLDQIARNFLVDVAYQLHVRLARLPMCNCPIPPSDCPDRFLWAILKSPQGAWLRFVSPECGSHPSALLQSGARSNASTWATIRHDGGSWYWLDLSGCEHSGLDGIVRALADGELPE